MKNQAGIEFLQSAQRYCSLIDTFDSKPINENLMSLLISLLDLYTKAIHLPDIESESEEAVDVFLTVPQINLGQYNDYWEVFNPYQLEEPVRTSLTDDILDIYKDVKQGIILYEKNDISEAIWEWKFTFTIHWGSHSVDAIRVLHSAIRDDSY